MVSLPFCLIILEALVLPQNLKSTDTSLKAFVRFPPHVKIVRTVAISLGPPCPTEAESVQPAVNSGREISSTVGPSFDPHCLVTSLFYKRTILLNEAMVQRILHCNSTIDVTSTKMYGVIRTSLGLAFVLTQVLGRPYHSTQGVLRNRASLNDFLTTYLQAVQERAAPQYGYLELQPSYQQGYISRRPRRISHRVEPFVQYLRSADWQPDYPTYDYPGTLDETYTDSDGTWYDDAPGTVIGSPSYVPQTSAAAEMLDNEPTEQDLALAQLMLDHIAGKYSLEDLETLEREARMEENTEHQLRALTHKMHRKKSLVMPFISEDKHSHSGSQSHSLNHGVANARSSSRLSQSRPSANSLLSITQRRGQKEEPVMVPATSVRRPVFIQQLEQEKNPSEDPSSDAHQPEVIQKKDLETPASPSPMPATSGSAKTMENADSLAVSKSTPVLDSPVGSPRTSGVVEVVKVGPQNEKSTSEENVSSTMAPYVQSAYEALKHYLDTEREARMNADQEIYKTPQKRFVQESDPLAPRTAGYRIRLWSLRHSPSSSIAMTLEECGYCGAKALILLELLALQPLLGLYSKIATFLMDKN
ncbi:hypothetical protein FHG87_014376 [Trinorchestia longiramus]|nr:hypothetical protein FHG87_014376 [Trinorchestia longiramus]